MTISVIVPVYNALQYVGAALDSILAQTRPADEIIVVDDGSTDGSTGVVERYGQAVRLLRQENRGPAAALNVGLRSARGDAIAFLDADDLWLPEKLALQDPVLEGDPSVDGIFGLVTQFLSDDADEASGRFVIPSEPMAGINRQCLLMRRSAFDRFGWFDESLRASDFIPWYARAAALGFRSRVLDAVVARRRIHLGNTGIVRRHEQQQDSLSGLQQGLAIRRKNLAPGT